MLNLPERDPPQTAHPQGGRAQPHPMHQVVRNAHRAALKQLSIPQCPYLSLPLLAGQSLDHLLVFPPRQSEGPRH